jgi:hypothetical protein
MGSRVELEVNFNLSNRTIIFSRIGINSPNLFKRSFSSTSANSIRHSNSNSDFGLTNIKFKKKLINIFLINSVLLLLLIVINYFSFL